MATKPRDWADDDEGDEVVAQELPPPQTIQNKDGTKTTITYALNEQGQKVKTTRRIRLVTHREVVNPRVAERKTWTKFGLSEKDGAGPQTDTTSVGENIILKLSTNWKKDTKDEAKDASANAMKEKLKDKSVKCRICNGEHFTARCPYKDTMAPVGAEGGSADVAAGTFDSDPMGGPGGGAGGGGGLGKKGSYVPPALRGGPGGGAGEKMTAPAAAAASLASATTLPRCASQTSPRWQRSTSCATCLSASAASPASSSQRTATRAWQRASPSSASPTGPTPSRPQTRWTVMVSST